MIALRLRSDKSPGDSLERAEADLAFREFLLTKEVLLDPKRRAMYDKGTNAAYILKIITDTKSSVDPHVEKEKTKC